MDKISMKAAEERLARHLQDEVQATRENNIERGIDADYVDGLTPMDDDFARQLGGNMSKHDIPNHNNMKREVSWVEGYVANLNLASHVSPASMYPTQGREEILKATEYMKKRVKSIHDAFDYKREYEQIIRDAAVSGEGIGRVEVKKTRSGQVVSTLRRRNWRGVWYDTTNERDDFEDSRYIFDLSYQDIDIVSLKHDIKEEELLEYAKIATLNKSIDESLVFYNNRYHSENYYLSEEFAYRKQVGYGQVWWKQFCSCN